MTPWTKVKLLPKAIKQYLIVTGSYWAFTLTDGALRMLVLLHFHQLGFSPLALALLFVFYEIFGVVTNLVGGWLGAKIGLNKTMQIGLLLQVIALLMLTIPPEYLSILWVMFAQALSGIAKDLNKMSAKSSIKSLVPQDQQGRLFRWVALLTGSKNTLKGVGFFLGAFLLSTLGFRVTLGVMALFLAVVAMFSIILLNEDIGKVKHKIKFKTLFAKNASLNYLSAARLTLFAARDVWFVVALPVYLSSEFSWSFHTIGIFMALWIILYGVVQANTPKISNTFSKSTSVTQSNENSHVKASVNSVTKWGGVLSIICLLIPIFLNTGISEQIVIVIGLLSFGFVFAINSSLHSYLIIACANEDGVSLDVGFYYMANALGRLLGTVLSGWVFQLYGFGICLVFSAVLVGLSVLFIRKVA